MMADVSHKIVQNPVCFKCENSSGASDPVLPQYRATQ